MVVRGKPHTREALLAALAKPPASGLAALPDLELEGTKLAAARYDVAMNGTVIGHERALLSKLADGKPVVRGQAAYDTPQMVLQYRATADGVEFADGITVKRDGTKVVAKPKAGAAVELATTADAVIAPQSVAEFVWYGTKLASLGVGASTKLAVAAVSIDSSVKLDPAAYTFKRLADADGRRSYEYAGKQGALDIAGTFSIDADGAPHDIEVKVKWGTFLTKRVE